MRVNGPSRRTPNRSSFLRPFAYATAGLLTLGLVFEGMATRSSPLPALERRHEAAAALLKDASALLETGKPEKAEESLRKAADEVLKMGAGFLLSPALAERMQGLAEELVSFDALRSAFPLSFFLKRLAGLKKDLETAQPLRFHRSYTGQTTLEGPAVGGHASSPEPAPRSPKPMDDVLSLPEDALQLYFEAVPIISEKTFCGGRSKDHILESGGGGVALLDYDNDGLLDIFLVNAYQLTADREKIPHPHLLYRNLGDWKFENVSATAGVDLPSWGYGVCVGDYNNNGYLDIYVTNFGPNYLFRNNGDGTFTEVAARLGVDHPGWSTGCAFFDADQDGYLDLYVANYVETGWDEVLYATRTLIWRGGPEVMAGPVGLKAARDVFYRNDGGERFVAASHVFETGSESYGLGVLAADLGDDGLPDLYVANDSQANYLFRNRQGRFVESGLEVGAALSGDGRGQAGMGVDAADVDGDGLPDLIVTNFAHDYYTLYRNLGGGMFEDVTRAWGLYSRTFMPLGWGVAFFDADLDGEVDLIVANGHLYPQVDEHPELEESFRQRNQLFLNEKGTFRDVSARAGPGLLTRKSSRGLAVGDLDNDGRMDVVISNLDDAPTVLRNLSAPDRHWILLDVKRESGTNLFCIGARITLQAGGRRQIREIRSGGGYLSHNDLRVHFGLGDYPGPVDVTVEIPGHGRWEWRDLPVNRLVSLRISNP